MFRWTRLFVGVSALIILISMPYYALGQLNGTATITGVVRDSSGAVMPRVTVQAASPALMKARSVSTDAVGQFRLVDLQTGIYTVTFSLPGFATLKRENITLAPNFTLTLNVALEVAAAGETVTVSSEPPQLDLQNLAQQETIGKSKLFNLPTAKTMLSFAALAPEVDIPTTAQDVGGSMGETSVRYSVHGASQNDEKELQDGMTFNSMGSDGTGRTFLINPLAVQEVVIDMGTAGEAEYSLGGAVVNMIPKDGGNQFHGTFYATGTYYGLQSSNLDSKLTAQGVTSVNAVRDIYDLNFEVGGPIVKDKLWFMTSHRHWGRLERFANIYQNANLTGWTYVPNYSKPAEAGENFQADTIRLTWQATPKQRFSLSGDYQNDNSNVQGGALSGGARTLEAITTPDVYCNEPYLVQATWNYVASPKLVIDAGESTLLSYRNQFITPCGGNIYAPSMTEQSTGITYHGAGYREINNTFQSNVRSAVSYVTHHHNLKVGMTYLRSFSAPTYEEYGSATLPVDYTLDNGVPTSLTEYVSPHVTNQGVRADLGIFAQDQWTLKRVTLSAGLHYSYLNVFSYALNAPAGILGPAATHYPEEDCLPCWQDLSPRFGAVWDVFGNGHTALKGGIDRYIQDTTLGLANTFGPTGSIVTSTTRSWTDTNLPSSAVNYQPNCDLTNPAKNGDCGAMANANFGTAVQSSFPDPDWIKGFDKRPANWLISAVAEQQLWSRTVLHFGYFRRWYVNQTTNDNVDTTPADYSPYCITAPTDSRLGSVSGSQICGLYNINPAQYGMSKEERTLTKKFGHYSDIYNGVDVDLNVRLLHGAQISGGWSLGDAVNTASTTGAIGITLDSNDQINQCFVVDTPQDLYNCKSRNPYLSQFKFSGWYPLPKGFEVSAVYQNLPGPNYEANYTVSSAAIAPSLGRPLSGGVKNVTIQVLPVDSAILNERTNQLDIRMSKIWRFGKKAEKQSFRINADVFNLFNGNNAVSVNSTYGPNWLQPTQVLDGRLGEFGVEYEF